MTDRPTTPEAALEHALASCCPSTLWAAQTEADDLLAALGDLGWRLTPIVSLPRSAPKGEPATAAASIDDLSDRQWAVWFIVQHFGPMPDEEVVERYEAGVFGSAGNILPPQTPQSIRSRRAELVRAGHVEAVPGERRPTSNGGTAQVWRAAGSAALREAS